MSDHEWLSHLAKAQWSGGRWVLREPQAALALARARADGALAALLEAAQDYGEALAELSQQRLRVKALPLQHQPSGTGEQGFLLLLGRCQITVQPAAGALLTTLTTVHGYERRSVPLHRFTPEADAFGGVVWRADNALLMDVELIIKRLFEDLTRAAQQAGDLAPGG